MYWSIAKYGAIVVTSVAIGWSVNGWRLNSKIHQIETKHLQGVADAERNAREVEKRLQAQADRLRRDKDHQIRLLNNRVAELLGGLQHRPEGSGIAANPRLGLSAQGCSGAFLYREHSEFLVREAARADTIREAYKQCQQQYEAIRNP